MRLAKGLPFVGPTITDLDHLLAAATIMTNSARDAMDVYENFSGEDSKLFADGQFSIPAIRQAQHSVEDIEGSLAGAEAELVQVKGDGFKGDDAVAKQKSATEADHLPARGDPGPDPAAGRAARARSAPKAARPTWSRS